MLIYLNSVARGGATHFVELGLRVKPVMGSALVFFPATIEGYVDGLTYHESEAAIDTKWVMQVWLRQKAWAVGSEVSLMKRNGRVVLGQLED